MREYFIRLCVFPIHGAFICLLMLISACSDSSGRINSTGNTENKEEVQKTQTEYPSKSTLLVIPAVPQPGKDFRIVAFGGEEIRKARIIINGTGKPDAEKSRSGKEWPYWQVFDCSGSSAGKYHVSLTSDNQEISRLDFEISPANTSAAKGIIWKSTRSWDGGMENAYSAWVNSLFDGFAEESSWTSLDKITQNKNQNFLYNSLSLDEDNPEGSNPVIMQPDCADNPFFLRAYFAWKLGLPFGYHICDRGYVGRNPKPGRWVTNETVSSKNNPVASFNNFLRMMRDGVQSGTARTALADENSDYYPVPLEKAALRPGTIFADPYGHTLIITGYVPQSRKNPGLLLSVDAQPDGTVGIKRFWKGNFLFNTSGVIGEPGFKAFRPIVMVKGAHVLTKNKELTLVKGFVPFSLQQRKMKPELFYHSMEKIINPRPLDPETAMINLLQALHEQLQVRVTSVANGEAWFQSHPGTIIPMPSSAPGIFQSGGQWEDFSTPNRDLRLLIAIDAVLDFPENVAKSPQDFGISSESKDQIRKKLQDVIDKKISGMTISYTHSDGSAEKLTVAEIIKRREALEMAYNPNDGIEIRWGAPEKSQEREKCQRRAPASQIEKMKSVRAWFSKRLHPPT